MLPPAPERPKASRSCRLKALAEKLDRLVEDFEKPLEGGSVRYQASGQAIGPERLAAGH